MTNRVELTVANISKKFINEWIFKNLQLTASSDHTYAVIGPNGSGKSTFLQCLSGLVPLTTGDLNFKVNGDSIAIDDIYRHISIVSPATELIDELTLNELFNFHTKFRTLTFDTAELFAEAVFLEKSLHKQVKNFSSGMKQRLKLGLAFYSSSDIIFFDEPTTNLDEFGCEWYASNCQNITKDRLVFVASNQKHEYEFCDRFINIVDFK